MKRLAMVVACAAVMFAGTALAQIPVTDAALIAKEQTSHLETIQKWVQQFNQMKDQITQLENQYKAVTGSRNLGDIFNDQALRNYLPQDWQQVYDSVRSGGYDSLSGKAAQIYSQNKIYDACQAIADQASKRSCEAMAVKPSQDKANVLTAFDAAKKRLDQINQLMGKINGTSDPKAIAELQARIASEQAMIANSQTEMQLYAMVAQAEEKVQQQQQREINAKANARKGVAPLQPATF